MKKVIFVLSAIIIFIGCKKGVKIVLIFKPDAAILSSPAQNSVCTSGTILSATKSSISFTWNASDHTEKYNLIIKNLLTLDSTIQTTTQTQASDTLLRNTPYSWHVVSISASNATAQSATWKFYNSGAGVITYAPFPAEITSPTFAQVISPTAGTINLTWTGSVIAPDIIASYDVYLGTTTSPAIAASAIANNFLNNVAVAANTTYFWRVVTRDSFGNTSDSGLYQFTVN